MTAERPVEADLTVVVPTVGRPTLRRSLAALAGGGTWPAEVVVVDQSGRGAVAGWLAASGLPARRIEAPRRGVAAARNRGIEQVGTRFFAIVDDDEIAAGDWVAALAAQLRQRPDAVVTGRVLPDGETAVPSTITSTAPGVHTRPLLRRDPLFAGNMGAAVVVADRVGPFDEHPTLDGAEDNDWGYRALKAGVPLVYAPGVVVTHLDWRDAGGLADVQRRYARAQGGFYGKHLRQRDGFIAARAVRDVIRGPWLVARGTVTRNRGLVAYGRAEVAGILPGIVAGFRRGRS